MNKSAKKDTAYEPWPELPYKKFQPTGHLLHMCLQVIGKLKLLTPFEPHWANVALWVTSRGLTTGLIPYKSGAFAIDIDFITHQILCTTTWGAVSGLELGPMSVAKFYHDFFDALRDIGVELTINPKPQEIPNPIPFDQDTESRPYESTLANAWWRILVSSQLVLERYRGRFHGETPPIGFMWGTFDLRDARYNGVKIPVDPKMDFIRRNAMDEKQSEAGWWSGNDGYPNPAYFSFIFPEPKGIENAKIQPSAAQWDNKLKLFRLDYDDVRKSKNPEKDLFDFFESTYQAGAKLAGWDPNLVIDGKPH